tara:strand:+ start:38 stop:169 length:132 start_codon:yes stop_codon:yes gene_type:complete
MAYISDAELELQKMESQKIGVIVLVLIVSALLFFVFKAIRKKK